jgi:NAD-dependent deacetylase
MIRRLESRTDASTSTEAARLAELIRESSCTVALTGAGISVPSGIPDFRSPGTGLWTKVDPMKVAHIDAFRRDPKAFWDYYRPRFAMLGDKRPNRGHEALAELERRGYLEAVITQNIDRLHRTAGSERVIEVHGSIETSSCQVCGASFRLEEVGELFVEGVAECRLCCGAVKPDVVLFGELLPERAMADAQELAARADLMLCVGSSLEVYPVAGLPELTLSSGGQVAIVTRSRTPYDGAAAVRLDGDVVAELDAVLAALGEASAPTHREVVERGFAGWNSGEVERFLETIHPEIVWEPSGVFPGLAERYQGHDGVRRFWRDFKETWEMIEVRAKEIRDVTPDSVLVGVHFRARGRGGIPVERDLVQHYRIRDGLLIEMHSYASWENALVATGGT